MNGQFFDTQTIANYSYIPNVKYQFQTLPLLTVIHFLFSDGDGDDDEDVETYDDGDFGGSDNDHDDEIIQLSLNHQFDEHFHQGNKLECLRHGSMLHSSDSFVSPSHSFPP